MLKLYSYFRSSASYRVRIALNWKGLHFDYIPVHLLKNGGEQHQSTFRGLNPMGHVPALEHDGFVIAESMAIIEYVDMLFTRKPLFPMEPRDRARVLQICEIINSGIQPLQNLKVNQLLEAEFGQSKTNVEKWNRHWIEKGFSSLEKILQGCSGTYTYGGDFTAADCFLVPQCFTARRFGVRVEDYPNIARVEESLLKWPEVQAAHPQKQPDFVP